MRLPMANGCEQVRALCRRLTRQCFVGHGATGGQQAGALHLIAHIVAPKRRRGVLDDLLRRLHSSRNVDHEQKQKRTSAKQWKCPRKKRASTNKLCLALFFALSALSHFFLPYPARVVQNTNVGRLSACLRIISLRRYVKLLSQCCLTHTRTLFACSGLPIEHEIALGRVVRLNFGCDGHRTVLVTKHLDAGQRHLQPLGNVTNVWNGGWRGSNQN